MICASCVDVSPDALFPTNILPAVPLDPAVPVHPVIVNVVPAAHATALLAAKVKLWFPVPNAKVELACTFIFPTVWLKPTVGPVCKVPPLKTISVVPNTPV